MTLPLPPTISEGQIALDPNNGVVYYKKGQDLVATTWTWLREGLSEVSTDDNVTITGNLVVSGSTVSVNVETVTVNDNIIVLNNNVTGSPTENAGIEVERGTSSNVSIRWNETLDVWELTVNGSTYKKILSGDQDVNTTDSVTFAAVNANLTGNVTGNVSGNLTGNVTGNVTGQVSSLENHGINSLNDVDATPSNGQFLKWNGSSWVNDSIDLTTDTTGDYVKNLTAGTGIILSGNSGEGATPSISIGQPVGTTDNVTFNQVTADLVGDVTGTVSDISNHILDDLSDVSISNAANGDFLRYQNNLWVNDAVNLSTDTVGDYVATVSAGTGISVTNAGGEGATPTITLNAGVNDLIDLQITSAANGQTLIYDGTNWVNTTFPSSEPIGHENKADSVISFDESSRQFSISPASTSYTVWCVGKRYVKTSTETVTIPDTSGLYYIYFNSSGSLAYKTTFFTWDQDTPTAYIYWNDVDNKAYFFADERHGVTLDWATHEYLHRTRGAAIANGFGANNYTLTGDGSLDAHATIDIANGTFFDEDLQVDIEHSASPAANTWQQRLQSGAYIPVFYRLNNNWKKDTATQFPIKNSGTRAQYNLNTAGTWSSTDVDNAKYGVMFLVATNNLNEPILAIMGQQQYTDQGSAEASTWDELDLAGFPVVEFRPLYKIVFQTANAYANTTKTKFVNLLDLRQIIASGAGGSSTAVSDHGSLTGLLDDDHTQYFNSTRHDAHDHSLALASASINDLQDVSITSATPNQGLIWDGSSWINQTIPLSLDGLSDVVISSATPNNVLKFDGSNWVNSSLPPAPSTSSYTETIGNGSDLSFVITHNLGTRNVFVSCRNANYPYEAYHIDSEATTINQVTLTFASAPDNNGLVITVIS